MQTELNILRTKYLIKDGDLLRVTRSDVKVDYQDTPVQVTEHDFVMRRDTLLSLGLDLPMNGEIAVIT